MPQKGGVLGVLQLDKPRIITLILNYLPTFSGHAIYLQQLIPLFMRNGYHVDVLTSGLGTFPALDCIDGVRVHRVYFDSREREAFLCFTFRVLSFLFRHRSEFDILHWHGNIDPYGLLLLACKLLRKKSIMQMVLMGSDDPESLKAQYRFMPARLRVILVDKFIQISKPLHESCVRAGYPTHKLSLIPQGVDTRKFCPVSEEGKTTIRSRLGLSADKKIVTFIGSVIHRKGVDMLISAWKMVQEQCPEAELILVGPCEFESEDYNAASSNAFVDLMKRQISDHSLNIRMVGRSSEVESFLQASDIFVLPSRKEGFGNVIIEAMSCGIPPVVTPMDNVALDSVTPGKTGIIVKSCEELSNALLILLKDDEQRKNLGANARIDVLERFTLNHIAEKYMALYDELL